MGIFTTRDIALAVWTTVFLGWAATKRDVRRSLSGVLRAAVRWKLLVLFMVLIAYTTCVVHVLHAIRFWSLDLLKDTIIWFLLSGVALAFSGVQSDSAPGIWRRVLRDQLKAIVLVEYIVNTYTFALWIELLVIPVLTCVALLDVIARTDAKYAVVAKLTGVLQAFFGLTVMAFAIHQAVSGQESFSAAGALREIALVPLLSVLLLPITHVFFLVSAYEQLFLRLALGPKKDPSVVWYAKRKLARHLGVRPETVRAFTHGNTVELMHATTKAEVDKLVQPKADGAFRAG
jgi:hypothetical protein